MKDCDVTIGGTAFVCNGLGEDGCAWARYEELDEKLKIKDIPTALQDPSVTIEHLKMWVEGRVGSSFNNCKIHELISKAAKKEIERRSKISL